MRVTTLTLYIYTGQQDQKSTVQNSGVTLIASTTENNTKDSYYGVIEEIWELDYNSFVIPLFKCKWVDNRRGLLIDIDGFTTVNFSTNGYASKPFILAKLATQVFYVEDPKDSRWHVVQFGKRHILGIDNVVDEDEYDKYDELPPFSTGIAPLDSVLDNTTYIRSDHNEGLLMDEALES
ncbi:hypothetical protein Tco_1105792 [Tanacetum coccineum]